MMNLMRSRLYICGLLFVLLGLFSCQNDEEKALRDKLASTEATKQLPPPTTLTPALINEYRQAELAINRRYVNETNAVVVDDFNRNLEAFEDNELGFFSSYKHMFKVLAYDDNEWNDYWRLKQAKYFSNLSVQKQFHECYQRYENDVQALRGQISNSPQCKVIPKEVRYNIEGSEILLSEIKQHTYNNLIMEQGVDIAVWLIIMAIFGILSLFVGSMAPPAWLITVITIVVSIILSSCNDRRMMDSLREQFQGQIEVDNGDVLNELDKSTNIFYDYVSK